MVINLIEGNMKKIFTQIMISCALLAALAACDSDGEVRHLGVTAVESLYGPKDGADVVLQNSSSATTLFEWQIARAEDSGLVQYEVAFDKADGNFSDPLYIVTADNRGATASATISHKVLNRIAALAGVGSAEKGTLKWTVYSSKGINPVKANEERTITITRLAGFADIPDQLYITGEATEVGADLSKALIMKKVADGEYEIYTQLTAGKTFKFVSAASGDPKEYSLSGEKLVEGGTSTVSETGIYKYYVDFNIGSFSTKRVTKVNFMHNWSQMKIELPYKGLGVWEITGHAITGDLDGNGDDRYKFRMESTAGETEWRAPNNDSKPSGNAAYYYMVEKDNVEQWTNGQIWKSPSTTGWSGKTYDIMFSLNPEGEYTHNLIVKE